MIISCVESIDIGAYNSCDHQCLYCYANYNKSVVDKSILLHDVCSLFLIGHLEAGDRVTERKMVSQIDGQMRMF